jgi:hypothetical protein
MFAPGSALPHSAGGGATLRQRDVRVWLGYSAGTLEAFVRAMDQIESEFAGAIGAILRKGNGPGPGTGRGHGQGHVQGHVQGHRRAYGYGYGRNGDA